MVERHQQILNDIVTIARDEFAPRKIILFGSRAKNSHANGSDFDIAIDAAPVTDEQKQRARERIEQASGLYNVDLVFLEDVDAGFKQIILSTGKTLYEQ